MSLLYRSISSLSPKKENERARERWRRESAAASAVGEEDTKKKRDPRDEQREFKIFELLHTADGPPRLSLDLQAVADVIKPFSPPFFRCLFLPHLGPLNPI